MLLLAVRTDALLPQQPMYSMVQARRSAAQQQHDCFLVLSPSDRAKGARPPFFCPCADRLAVQPKSWRASRERVGGWPLVWGGPLIGGVQASCRCLWVPVRWFLLSVCTLSGEAAVRARAQV